jgi:hypothetical protein
MNGCNAGTKEMENHRDVLVSQIFLNVAALLK